MSLCLPIILPVLFVVCDHCGIRQADTTCDCGARLCEECLEDHSEEGH